MLTTLLACNPPRTTVGLGCRTNRHLLRDKILTATALALLVDEGRLDWDMPVRAVLPEFRLRDPVTTEQASLRDLLTHRTGLPRHDGVHVDGHLTMPAYLPR